MTHETTHSPGTDARNHTTRCTCGWAFSGTWLAVRYRSGLHCVIFKDEDRAWNDPRRQTEMPQTSSYRT